MPHPDLLRHDRVVRPAGLVLMLHGGRAHGQAPVDEKSASWRRTRWMMGQVEARLHAADCNVWLLRFGVRGWNAGSGVPSPVPDARWAMEQVRAEYGADLPVVLLGHSMGARTAVAVADDPSVSGVVALAPWLPADEPVQPLAGRHLAAAHGSTDPITSAQQTRTFVERARQVAASAEFADMGRIGHYMFRRIPAWNAFAVDRSVAFVQHPAER
jgi:alpha-beta hydrolase superfamily lysophospholipase